MSNIEKDKQTVRLMIGLYGRHKLHQKEMPEEYRQLADYACLRLSHCPWGEKKPACKNCPHHCYTPRMREQIRMIMKWAGPRMIFYAPWATLRHLLK